MSFEEHKLTSISNVQGDFIKTDAEFYHIFILKFIEMFYMLCFPLDLLYLVYKASPKKQK